MVLITVMSVMNGFTKEIRTRILNVTPHLTVSPWSSSLTDWKSAQKALTNHKDVIAVAPFVEGQGMFIQGKQVLGVHLHGILPDEIEQVFPLHAAMIEGNAHNLKEGEFGVILGVRLAHHLGVDVGDLVTLIVPEVTVSLAGASPRIKRLKVVGIFEVGYLYDNNFAFLNLNDAAKLFKTGTGVSGIQAKLDDPFASPRVVQELNAATRGQYKIVDWTMANSTYFSAVKMEKTMMFFTLLLILCIAVFNLISTLVMVVTDKKSDIALLRTLGASTRSVMAIFVSQGSFIGLIGTLLGVTAGIALSLNVTRLVDFVEKTFSVQFLSKDVYFISFLPSDLHLKDVAIIGLCAFILSLLATLWPAWRASQVEPAKALRQDL